MLEAFFFFLFWAANFVWLMLIIGSVMAHFMEPGKNKNAIIICTVAVIALLFVLWMRKPQFDDTIMTNCYAMTDGC